MLIPPIKCCILSQLDLPIQRATNPSSASKMDSQLKISHLLSVFSKKHRSELESELGMPLENFLYGSNDLTDELEQGEQASGGGYGDVYLYQAKDKENSSKLSSCASDMFAVKKLRYWEANERTGKVRIGNPSALMFCVANCQ